MAWRGDGCILLLSGTGALSQCFWMAKGGERFQEAFECCCGLFYAPLSQPSRINETYLLMIAGMSRINLLAVFKCC